MQNGRQKEKEEEKKQREKNREEPELPAHEIDSFGRPLTFLLNHLIFWVVAVESRFFYNARGRVLRIFGLCQGSLEVAMQSDYMLYF